MKDRHNSNWSCWAMGGLLLLQVLALLLALVLLLPGQPAQPPLSPQPIRTAVLLPAPTPPPTPAVPLPAPPPTPTETPPAVVVTTSPPVSPTTSLPLAHLRGMEVTQGIQVFNEPEDPRCLPHPEQPDDIFCNNSIPLVAGRRTLVRVYPACAGACPTTGLTLRLGLWQNGREVASQEQALSAALLSRVNGLPLPELRLSLANSVNFEFFPLPPELTGPVTFELAAAPEQGTAAPVTWLTLTKSLTPRKPLRIAYLPIQYQGFTPTEPPDIDYWLLRMYPVPAVEYYRLPMPDLVWEGELSKAEILRRLLYTYWLYALYHPATPLPDQLFGWLPQEFFNGGASDPYWCPDCGGPHSSRIAFGGLRPEPDIGGPRILVHEIAHNLGAQHAWSPTAAEDRDCFRADGIDIRVDPTWPYPQTPRIQEFGIDLYSQPPVIYSPAFYDMMAYCTPPWISPHTYRKIFDSPFLQPDNPAAQALTGLEPPAAPGTNGTILVSGLVYPNGTVSQPEILRLEGNAFTGPVTLPASLSSQPSSGAADYCLEVRAGAAMPSTRHCFPAGFTDLETGRSDEASPYVIALPASAVPETAQVALTQNNVTLTVLTPSNASPRVEVIYPNGGEVLTGRQTITWQADDPDGDTLQYDILYSADSGQTWLPLAVRLRRSSYTFYTDQLPAGLDSLVRVVASDGAHSTSDDSDGSFVVEPPQANSVSLRGPATVQPGQTFEVALVANQVTPPGLFGVQYKLKFDPAHMQVESLSLQPALDLVIDRTIQNDLGQVTVAASRRGQVDNLTGDITLATLRCTATQAAGAISLQLQDIVAGTRGGLRLDILPESGLTVPVTR